MAIALSMVLLMLGVSGCSQKKIKSEGTQSSVDTGFESKKGGVANAMADHGAVLNLANGADGDGNTPTDALMGQPLYQMELPVAGSQWYMENEYEHRDASYEEIFHMVHDLGIGTTQNSGAFLHSLKKSRRGWIRRFQRIKMIGGNKEFGGWIPRNG